MKRIITAALIIVPVLCTVASAQAPSWVRIGRHLGWGWGPGYHSGCYDCGMAVDYWEAPVEYPLQEQILPSPGIPVPEAQTSLTPRAGLEPSTAPLQPPVASNYPESGYPTPALRRLPGLTEHLLDSPLEASVLIRHQDGL